MALYVNTNVSSLEAQRSLATNTVQQATTFQRLSSGLRINTAADDAAGHDDDSSLELPRFVQPDHAIGSGTAAESSAPAVPATR